MKKISDVTADDMIDTDEQSLKEDTESKLIKDGLDPEDEVTNRMPRSLIASKLLHVPCKFLPVLPLNSKSSVCFFLGGRGGRGGGGRSRLFEMTENRN